MLPATDPDTTPVPRRLIAALVLMRVLIPLALVHPEWEFQRDEMLYFAMGDHLAWRMQFPPMIAVIAHLSATVFGDTVWAARVPAALAGGALTGVVLTLVRKLGGGRFAAWCAWLALLAAPVYMRPSVLFQPVILDQLWAAAAVAALVLAAREDRPSRWLFVGTALGLGLLTKASAVMYGAVILGVTLVHPRLRPQLATRWPWLGALMAFTLGLPSLLGQIHFGWPFLQQLEILQRTQLTHTSVFGTIMGQGFLLCGATFAVGAALWAAIRSLRRKDAPKSEPNAFTVEAQLAALFAIGLLGAILWRGGKDYYAAPAYPVLVGVGAVWLAPRLGRTRKTVLQVVVGTIALVVAPMGIPMLAPEPMERYAAALGVGTTTNRGGKLALPQDYADMLGWREEAEAVAAEYAKLTPAEQAVTTIAGGNFGQTGALAVFRRRFGYPYPVSSAGDFHAWGPGEHNGEVLIVAASPDALEDLQQLYADVRVVRKLRDSRRVFEEQEVHIFLCRQPRKPLAEIWPSIGPEWD